MWVAMMSSHVLFNILLLRVLFFGKHSVCAGTRHHLSVCSCRFSSSNHVRNVGRIIIYTHILGIGNFSLERDFSRCFFLSVPAL